MLDTTKKITAVTYNGNNWNVGGRGLDVYTSYYSAVPLEKYYGQAAFNNPQFRESVTTEFGGTE